MLELSELSVYDLKIFAESASKEIGAAWNRNALAQLEHKKI